MDTLRVKFTHYTKVRDRHPYTVYEIAVQSSSTISWVIYKRYKDFDKLHKMLSKGLRLPTLPPKRLFQIMEATFVETRMAQLQEYMSKLLQLPNLMRNPVLIQFLKVPDSVKPMLLNDSSLGGGRDKGSSRKASPSGAQVRPTYPNKSYEERRVYELVDALRQSSNQVAAITDFESYFFRYRPRLSKDVIGYLFLGQNTGSEGKNSGGLLETCGNHDYSKVASRSALDLICRLLDVERNKDAHTYVEIFVGLGTSKLCRLNIRNHIDQERGSRLGAFRLLSVLRERMGTRKVEEILGDDNARKQYFRWAERKRGHVAPIANKPQTSTLLKSVNLVDIPPKKVARDAFKSILETAKGGGWMEVRPIFKLHQNGSSAINDDAATLQPQNDTKTQETVEKLTAEEGSVMVASSTAPKAGSGTAAGSASALPSKPMLKIEYKIEREIVMVRTQCIMDFEISRITRLILDTSRRDRWDLKFHRGHVVARLGNSIDIVHYVFKSFSSPYKYRDFCLLRSWTELQNGGQLVVMRSVIHPRVPEQKDYIRAIFYPTGFLVVPAATPSPSPMVSDVNTSSAAEPSKQDASHESESGDHNGGEKSNNKKGGGSGSESRSRCRSLVTFVAQMDRDSVLLMSPDLLGETDELLVSIMNMQNVLRAEVERENQGQVQVVMSSGAGGARSSSSSGGIFRNAGDDAVVKTAGRGLEGKQE